MYLNSSNKNNIGSYFKLSYSFKNEQRDNIEYPLNGSLAEITSQKILELNQILTILK